MTMNTITNGVDTSFSTKLNTNFGHSAATSATSTLSFTPTDATTNVLIIAKGELYEGGTTLSGYVTLNSSVDGQLDKANVNLASTSGNATSPFCLMYTGNLSDSAHTLTVSVSGVSSSSLKITALEFL